MMTVKNAQLNIPRNSIVIDDDCEERCAEKLLNLRYWRMGWSVDLDTTFEWNVKRRTPARINSRRYVIQWSWSVSAFSADHLGELMDGLGWHYQKHVHLSHPLPGSKNGLAVRAEYLSLGPNLPADGTQRT